MLSNNYTKILLGLQDVIVKNMEEKSEKIEISIEMERHECTCPKCEKKQVKYTTTDSK